MDLFNMSMSDHPRVQHAVHAAATLALATTTNFWERFEGRFTMVEGRMGAAVDGIMSSSFGRSIDRYPRVKTALKIAPEVPRAVVGLAVWVLMDLAEEPLGNVSSRRRTHEILRGKID